MKARLLFFFLLIIFTNVLVPAQLHGQDKGKVDSLLIVLNHSPDDTGKVHTLNSLANELAGKWSYDSAIKYVSDAKKLGERLHYKKGLAQALSVIGSIDLNQSHYEDALKNNLQSLRLFEEVADTPGIVASYRSIALVYELQASYVEAMKNYLIALKIDEHRRSDKDAVAIDYANIGNIYARQHNYAEALKNYSQCLNVFKLSGNKQSIATIYCNIGNLAYEQQNYSEALENYNAALAIQKEINNSIALGNTYNNIGAINSDLKNFPEALRNFSLALKIYEDAGDKRRIAMIYSNIGEVYTKQKKYDEAKKMLAQGVQLSKEIGAKGILKDCYKAMAELAEATGDYQNAYEYHLLFSQLKDSLLNENNNRQIAEMKTKYEAEKKDREIEVQTIKIEKQRNAVRYLLAGLLLFIVFGLIYFRLYNRKRWLAFMHQVSETEMKALRAQMNPHFIFNSLNSIHRYMQENNFKAASAYLISFSKLIRLILENSLYKEVPLADELKGLELFLSLEATRLNHKFSYEINIDKEIDKENILIPPLILQPFVENSVWHGFNTKEGKGKIILSIKQDGEMLQCTIQDNGIGRNAHSQNQEGIDTGKKTSVGMRLTEERISIMNKIKKSNAQIIITDLFDDMKQPAGTRVELFLPLERAY